MRKILATAGTALVMLSFGAAQAAAQNREHLQMAAELRLLQEQTQQLALTLAQLGEAIKAVNARIDETNAATRKAFADQKLAIDAINDAVAVVRERTGDTNVRLGTLRDELEAIRTSLPTLASQAPAPVTDPADPNAAGANSALPPSPAPSTAGLSPTRMYQQAFADFGAGQYTLAISGFEAFLKTFPRSEMADDAQFYIGEAQYALNRFPDAVAAYTAVVQTYPMGDQVPFALYKRGLAQERLGQADAARASWEMAIKNYPDHDGARLAKQSLDRLGRQQTPAGRE